MFTSQCVQQQTCSAYSQKLSVSPVLGCDGGTIFYVLTPANWICNGQNHLRLLLYPYWVIHVGITDLFIT
uniref:Uncharacterized protein n=1 Tax=Anguilla anguilla TaxID=7936 RepID=A0A0E9V2D9_ANGAN